MNPTSPKQLQPAPFDVWAVLDFWLRRWRWLAGWTVLLAIAGGFLAHALWRTSFTSSAELIHYEPSAVDDTYHPRDLATPSLIVMLESPGFLTDVGAHLQPPRSAKQLAHQLQINLDRNNDVAAVIADGASPAEAIDLVQRYCDAVVAYTQTMQRREALKSAESMRNGNVLSGTVTGLDSTKIDTILASPTDYYMNFHNTPFPAGFVRDQLPEPSCLAVLGLGGLLLGRRRRA